MCFRWGLGQVVLFYDSHKSCFLISNTTADNSYIYIYIYICYFVIILSYDYGCQSAFSAQDKGNQNHYSHYFNNNNNNNNF